MGISVLFGKSMTFLFGSAFFIRQDLLTLCTWLGERPKPSNLWKVTLHIQWSSYKKSSKENFGKDRKVKGRKRSL